jgi:SAM-dependent methyltransferase
MLTARLSWPAALVAVALLAGVPAIASEAATPAAAAPQAAARPDVIYVPTPPEVVDAMLKVANVGPNDVLYDLGSGDGRIPVTAAQRFGTRGVGVDIDPQRIAEANANAKASKVTDKVRFIQGDLFKQDLSQATVISLYLLPGLNARLKPTLLKLKPGTRIVSHAFQMPDWEPEQTLDVNGRKVYFWTVPQPK